MKINKEKVKNITTVILLIMIILVVFQYTLEIRKPWFGKISDGGHQWLSGTTLKYSRIWWDQGAVNLKFATFANPSSVEFPNLKSQIPELSYPPGEIIPIYTISKIINQEPNLNIVMGYNLFNHFLIIVFLSLIIFIFLRQIGFNIFYSFLFSIIPILTESLLPGPIYWHQNVFFADQAVILPFVLIIFLAVIRDNIKNQAKFKILNFIEALVFFWGIMTDWLFIFVFLTIYILRFKPYKIKNNFYIIFKKTLIFWLPIIIAALLYIAQLIRFDLIKLIIYKLNYYSFAGSNSKIMFFSAHFWLSYIPNYFGRAGSIILMGIIFLFGLIIWQIIILKRRKEIIDIKVKKIMSLASIALIPCLLQIYFFPHHSYVHDFSTLKFSIPMALLPFILIPLAIVFILELDIDFKKINTKATVLIIILLIIAGTYTIKEHSRAIKIFPTPKKSFHIIGNFLDKNTEYEDVVFSPDIEIAANPPQELALSMKRVYKIDSLDEISKKVKGRTEEFVINIFFTKKDNMEKFQEIKDSAYETRQDEINNLYLYKIKKDYFINN